MAEISTALRTLTRETAAERCEYCLTPEEFSLTTYEVDHIIALKHGGKTAPDNLAFCCALCNRHKGTDIASIDPETGSVVPLFHSEQEPALKRFLQDLPAFLFCVAGCTK
jgi:hypothetical protein